MVSDLPFGFGPPDPDDPDDSDTPADPFSAMLGGMGAADLGAALQRFGQLLSTSSGPVHWELAHDTARQVVAAEGDPSVTPAERAAVIEAVELAELWLDDATALPSATTSVEAWSRAEWIEQTLPRWKSLIAPLAERMSAATSESLPGQMPEEMRAMAAPLMGVMSQMSGVMFGGQVGQGLGALAQEVLSSTDVGVPLTSAGSSLWCHATSPHFGEGLGIPDDQVRLYLALRECAHVRLFHHAPWLRRTHRGRGRRLRPRDLGRHRRDRECPRRHRPEHGRRRWPSSCRPASSSRRPPPSSRPPWTGSRRCSRWSRDGWTTSPHRGRRSAPGVRRAARDDASTSRVRRSGRAHLRDAGRPPAAAPPTARGRRTLAHLRERALADRP